MDQQELDRTHAERHRYFTLSWFGRLLRGDLSLGDTFWIGNYGIALFTVPFGTLLALVARMISEATFGSFLMACGGVLALYHLTLTRAVWLTARRTPSAGGWRWVGVVLSLLNALLALVVLKAGYDVLAAPAVSLSAQ